MTETKHGRLILICPRCKDERSTVALPNGDLLARWQVETLESTAKLPWPLPLSFVCPVCGYHAPVNRWPMTVGISEGVPQENTL